MPKISELPAGTTPTGTESLAAVQSGVTVKLTSQLLASGAYFAQTGTGSVARSILDKLTESVSIVDFGAATTNTAAQNTTAIQAALNTGKAVYVPPGTWPCNTITILLGHTRLFGASRALSVLTSASTNTVLISIGADLDGIEISDLGLTRSVAATSGGIGINCLGYLDADFRNLEIQKQHVGMSLLSSGHGTLYNVWIHDSIADNLEATNTAANGNVQWKAINCLFETAGLRGVLIFSTAGPGQVTVGDWLLNDFFANGTFGFAAVGLAGVHINGLRLVGGVNGENGNSSIYLDTYGTDNSVDLVYTELSGTRTTGPGFSIAASHLGSGVEVTANNLDVTIDRTACDGHSEKGITSSASVSTSVSNCPIINNTGFGLVLADGSKAKYNGNTFANNTAGNVFISANSTSVVAAGNTPRTLNNTKASDLTDLGTGVATALAINVGSAGAFLTFNGNAGTPSALVGTNISGTAASLTAGTATNAVNSGITNDTATNATMFPAWVTANTGNLPLKVTSTKLTFNPSTGALSSTSFTGAGTGLTGTAASLTAGAVTGITVGTTNVASGAANGILYDSSGGVLSSTAAGTTGQILTGVTGSPAAWSSTPTVSTSITSPLLIGGSGTTGTQLTLQTTSGNGTTDQLIAVGGNNGATRIYTGLGTGKFGVGSAAGAQTPTNATFVASNNTAVSDGSQIFSIATVLQVVNADATNGGVVIDAFGGSIPAISFRQTRGTAASKTATASGDTIGAFFGQGYYTSGGTSYALGPQISLKAAEAWTSAANGSSLSFFVVKNTTAAQIESLKLQQSGATSFGSGAVGTDPGTDGAILAADSIKSMGATAGAGYATGAGGTVTQGTNRTTGVTLNKVCGAITLFSQVNTAVSGATAQTFTVTNSSVAATDTVIVNQKSGTDAYLTFVTNVAAGSFKITNYTTGGTTNEAPVFSFSVIKGVTS